MLAICDFFIFFCAAIILFLIQEIFWKDNLKNKNYQPKV